MNPLALTHYFQVTAEYTNALMVAVLPIVSHACQELHIPIPTPITISQVRAFAVPQTGRAVPLPEVDLCGLYLTNRCYFGIEDGCIDSFRDERHSYCSLHDDRSLLHLYAPFHMTKEQAIAMARGTLSRVGFSIEDLFMDGDPSSVEVAPMYGTNTLPYYRIYWICPDGRPSVDVEVDAYSRRITAWEILTTTRLKDPVVQPPRQMEVDSPLIDPLYVDHPTIVTTNILLDVLSHYSESEKLFGSAVTPPKSPSDVSDVVIGQAGERLRGGDAQR